MPVELLCLVVYSLWVSFAWIPGSIAKYQQFGFGWLSSNRESIPFEMDGWGGRVERAYQNLLANTPAFIAIVLVLGYLGAYHPLTAWSCVGFVLGRIAHFIAYAWGLPRWRALSFAVSLFALLCLHLVALVKLLDLPR